MQRRTLIKLMAASSLAGCGHVSKDAKGLKVIVAGAGIVGASIAYHLAKIGADVTVVDKVGPASHASRGTFAWINATWAKQPRGYHTLNQKGVANWHSLQQQLELPIHWGGSLEWFTDAQRQLRLAKQIEEQLEWGETARMINSAELALLEPNLLTHGAAQFAFSENDGAIDPVWATNALLNAAKEMGAKLIYPSEVLQAVSQNGRLQKVITDKGDIAADRLVLATGASTDAAKILAEIEIPQRSTPGVIAITKPMSRIINRIVVAPGVHIHQRTDGRIVLGEQDGAPKNTAHAGRLAGRPNEFPNREYSLQHANRILAIAEKFVPKIKDAEVEDVFIGWRPLPLDGHPVLGNTAQHPDIYLSIMHSGVTLAPIVGQLAAYEIVSGRQLSDLDNYRPGRKFEQVKRY